MVGQVVRPPRPGCTKQGTHGKESSLWGRGPPWAVAGRLQEESCCLGNRGFREKRVCERLDLGAAGGRRRQL